LRNELTAAPIANNVSGVKDHVRHIYCFFSLKTEKIPKKIDRKRCGNTVFSLAKDGETMLLAFEATPFLLFGADFC
jgi:hypothetical protein